MTTPVNERHVHFLQSLPATNASEALVSGNTPGSILNGIRGAAVNVLNGLQNASLSARARIYGLSHEVPFDRWFYHYGLENPISDAQISTKIQARVRALLSFAESLIRGVAALVQHCFAKVLGNMPTTESLNMLRAQWDSIRLSANAVISPAETVQAATTASEDGQLPIGRLLSRGFTQGTPYPS